MTVRPLVTALALGACSPEVRVELVQPRFAALLDLPDLRGELRISKAGGQPVASATVTSDGETFSAELPQLPPGEDLRLELDWMASGILVAGLRQPVSLRLEAGETSVLPLQAEDYAYPDTDGDGATDLTEVHFENVNPAVGGGAVADPSVAPHGFFSAIAQAVELQGAAFRPKVETNAAFVATASVDLTTGTPIYGPHRLDRIDLTDRARTGMEITCNPNEPPFGVAYSPDFNEVAVICDGRTQIFSVDDSLTPALIDEIPTPRASTLVFGRNGQVLYAVSSRAVYVILAGTTSPALLATLTPSDWGASNAAVTDVAVTDRHLILLEAETGGLVVYEHDATGVGVIPIARVLPGAFPDPFQAVMHPGGDRLYVANRNEGSIRVVDVSAPAVQAWSVVALINVGVDMFDLTIEPTTGAWLYAQTTRTIARIDTFTNEVGWRQDLTAGNQLSGVDIRGEWGIVGSVNDVLYVLGLAESNRQEVEPNGSVAEVVNTLGPLPDTRLGWVESSDAGTVRADHTVQLMSGPSIYNDDFEDLWRIDLQGVQRFALAVIPTSNWSPTALALVDHNGQVIDTRFWPGVSNYSTGVGELVISDVLGTSPAPLYAAVGALDYVSVFTPYELIAVGLPASLPMAAEVEPNDSLATQQVVISYPSVVSGTVDAAEVGVDVTGATFTDDFEDCYGVNPGNSRLAVYLEPGLPTADVNMFILDASGLPFEGYFLDFPVPGRGEVMIFEPRLQMLPSVCVGIFDTDPVTVSPYTLTFIDLDGV